MKNKLYQKGYTLNEKTKEIYYNDHIVRINEDLTIATIDKLETNISCTIQKDNANDYTILLDIENKNGIDEIRCEDNVLKCNGIEKIALDRDVLKEVGSIAIKVKALGKDYYEKYTIIPTAERMIRVANFDTLGDGTTKTIKVNKLENEYISTHYSMDDGSKWEKYEDEFDVLEIISATGNAIMEKDEYYRIAVKDTEYNVHMYVENEDTVIENDTIYGDQNAWSNQPGARGENGTSYSGGGGGAGGTGSCNIGTVNTGDYESFYSNY